MERQEIVSELKKAGFQLETKTERYGEVYRFGHLKYLVPHNVVHRHNTEVRKLVKRAWEMRSKGFGMKENIAAIEETAPVLTLIDNNPPEKKPEPKPYVERADREALGRRIWDLYMNAGMKHADIAVIFNTEHIPTPTGKSKWSKATIGNELSMYRTLLKRRRDEKKAQKIREEQEEATRPSLAEPPKKLEAPPQMELPHVERLVLPVSVCLLLEDQTIASDKKLAVIAALGIKLPPSASLIFDDDEMTSEQKVAVLQALL